MLKYYAVAGTLKAFSLTPSTRRAYRHLGNTVGASRRSKAGLPDHYKERARWVLRVFGDYEVPRSGVRFLELGTGWLHWESTVLRLFYDASITLFDVWDNRQFDAFKAYFSDYANVLEGETWIPSDDRERALGLLRKVLDVGSFAEVYELLGFEYVVEPTGSLAGLGHQTYDACFSYNVFEHIERSILPEYLKDLSRLLKPGGHAFIHIDISDHLANYDTSVARKNYLRYSEAYWDRCFENDVQYFNRIQRSDWLRLFEQAGFELIHEKSMLEPFDAVVDAQYGHLDKTDVECVGLDLVYRTPG